VPQAGRRPGRGQPGDKFTGAHHSFDSNNPCATSRAREPNAPATRAPRRDPQVCGQYREWPRSSGPPAIGPHVVSWPISARISRGTRDGDVMEGNHVNWGNRPVRLVYYPRIVACSMTRSTSCSGSSYPVESMITNAARRRDANPLPVHRSRASRPHRDHLHLADLATTRCTELQGQNAAPGPVSEAATRVYARSWRTALKPTRSPRDAERAAQRRPQHSAPTVIGNSRRAAPRRALIEADALATCARAARRRSSCTRRHVTSAPRVRGPFLISARHRARDTSDPPAADTLP